MNETTGALTILQAGTATITVTAAETATYAQATKDVNVTVNTKAMTVTAADVNVTVDGQPHGIIVNVTAPASGATVKYGTEEGSYTLDASPTQTEAGTKNVYYQVTADNYTTYTGIATVTVSAKQRQIITAADVTATYGDTGKKVTATTNGNGAISYEVKDGSADYIDVDASTGALTIKKVGTATVVVTAAETSTYAQATKEVTVTINKAAPTVTTPTAKTLTYNGQKQELVNAGSATGGTMYYAVTTGNTAPADNLYTTSIPTATEAGTYYVWYKVAGDINHNDTTAVCVPVAILSVGLDPEAPVDESALVYNGTAQALVRAGDVDGGTMMYAVTTDATRPDEGDYRASVATARDAGTYYVWYYVKGDKNHKNTEPEALEVTIAPRPVTVIADTKSKVEGEADPALTYTARGLAEGDALTGALTRDAGEAVGSYVIKQGTLAAGDNYILTFNGARLTITAKPETPAEPEATAEPEAPAKPGYLLLAKLTASGKRALKLTWTKVPGAEGFDIYLGRCGQQNLEQVAAVGGSTHSYTIKGLKKYDAYKVYVVAWKTVNGVKTTIGESPAAHAITGGYTNKYTNPKKVSVKKGKVKLAVGKTAKVKASVTKVKNSRNLMNHESKLRYYSSNPAVATVSANGRITAVGAGSCKIYAIAINGARAAVKVTVK